MSSGNRPEDNTSEDYRSEDEVYWEDAEEYGISKEKSRQAVNHQKVHRLRRYNIRMLILSIVMLMALCVLLIARVRTLDGTVAKLTAQVENLTRLTVQQREMMERMSESAQSAMGDSAVVGELEKEDAEGGQKADSEEWELEDADSEDGITAAHKVYLTFDDGPSPNTEKVLDILDRYDVKATFFVVGTACEGNEDILEKIVEAGHTLGMHSNTHDYSELYESVERFGEDLKAQQDYLYEATGVKSRVYRFPGGSSNQVSDIEMKEFARYLDSQGVRFFDWNISSGDGGSYQFPAETIYENVISNVSKYKTSVVLMHDSAGKATTLEALPDILEAIQAMEDTVILPITGGTKPVQHIKWQDED